MLGTAITVESDCPEVSEMIALLLEPFHRPGLAPSPGCRWSVTSTPAARAPSYLLHRDGRPMFRDHSWPAVVHELLAHLNARALEGFAGLAIHSGVVAGQAGAVAFPAPSGAGKSTLTAACLAAEFAYVSDEALCLEFDTAAVIPYPRPLLLSENACSRAGVPALGRQLIADEQALVAQDFGLPPAQGDLNLAHVLRLQRGPGRPALARMDRAEVVSLLLSMSFNHFRNPLGSFSLVTRLAQESQAWQLDYDDPRAGAELLKAKLFE